MKRLLACFALCTSLVAHAAPPTQVDATYAIFKKGQQVGEVTETYRRKGNTYSISSETKAVGVFAWFTKGAVKYVSKGSVGTGGLRPVSFEHWRGNDAAKRVSASFDWKQHTLTLNHDGQTTTEPLPDGLQDRISMMYQFMFLPHSQGKLELAHTNGKSIIRETYLQAGVERTMTGAGELKVLQYTRQKSDKSESAQFWLATDRSFFPVRVEIEEQDGKLEQVLTSLKMK